MKYSILALTVLALAGCFSHRETAVAAANIHEAAVALQQGVAGEKALEAITHQAAAIHARYDDEAAPTVTVADWERDEDEALVLSVAQAEAVTEEGGLLWTVIISTVTGLVAAGLGLAVGLPLKSRVRMVEAAVKKRTTTRK